MASSHSVASDSPQTACAVLTEGRSRTGKGVCLESQMRDAELPGKKEERKPLCGGRREDEYLPDQPGEVWRIPSPPNSQMYKSAGGRY